MTNYTPYDHPRKGIFRVEANKFDLEKGWLQKEEEHTIIGETEDTFVYEVKPFQYGVWQGDEVVQKEVTLHSGIHKTRLIKWMASQLSIF